MKQPLTIYHIVLDRSGSMDDCLDATLSGFKEQIQTIQSLQKKFPDQQIKMGLTVFNEMVEDLYMNRNPQQAEPLTRQNYIPSGGTALYDAIYRTAFHIERGIKEFGDPENTNVVMVILTDGYENASRKTNLQGVRELITRLEKTGKWTFNFLGATLDAVEVAEKMAIHRNHSMAFAKRDLNSKAFKRMESYMDEYMGELDNSIKEKRSFNKSKIKFDDKDNPIE